MVSRQATEHGGYDSPMPDSLAQLDGTRLILFGTAIVAGLILWTSGRTVLRPSLGVAGAALGGLLGWSVIQSAEQLEWPWVWVGATTVIGGALAILLFRIWMGLSLAVILAIAGPVAALSWQKQPLPTLGGSPPRLVAAQATSREYVEVDADADTDADARNGVEPDATADRGEADAPRRGPRDFIDEAVARQLEREADRLLRRLPAPRDDVPDASEPDGEPPARPEADADAPSLQLPGIFDLPGVGDPARDDNSETGDGGGWRDEAPSDAPRREDARDGPAGAIGEAARSTLDAVFERIGQFLSEVTGGQSDRLAEWWGDLPEEARRMTWVSSLSGAVMGMLLGLALPKTAASLVTSGAGALLVAVGVVGLLPLVGLDEEAAPMLGPRGRVVVVGLITLTGAVVQWTLWRRKADT